MERNEEYQIINHQEIDDIAELIKSPDFEVRQKAAKNLADIAFKLIETTDGANHLSEMLKFETESKIIGHVEANQIARNYESFFNSIKDFLFVLDEAGSIINMNATVLDRLGYSKEELIGQSVLMIHPAERREEAGKIVRDMLLGDVEFCPVPIATKDGIQIPVETRVTPGFWDGKPVLFGVTNDITELQLSEEKFSKVFHLNPSACGLSDVKTGKYIELNDAFYKLLGFTKEEVIGKTAVDLGILSIDQINLIIKKANSGGKVVNIEAQLNAKNGDVKYVMLSAENIYVQNKRYRYTVVNDITEQKKIEDELRKSEEKMRATVSALPDTMFFLNKDGIFLDCQVNEGSQLYVDRESFIGKALPDVMPSAIAQNGMEAIQAAIETNRLQTFEYAINLPNGKQSFEMRIVKSNEDECLGIARNITDQKNLEDELKRLVLTDKLTGLYSRNHLEEQKEILKTSRRYPISIINIDVDGLSVANNEFGHQTGDQLLKSVASVLRDVFRKEDCVAREGGDEFVILLPNTDEETASRTVSRIRDRIVKHNSNIHEVPISISIGLATAYDSKSWDEIYKLADERMYEEKNCKKQEADSSHLYNS